MLLVTNLVCFFFSDGSKKKNNLQKQMEVLYVQLILERNKKKELDGIRIGLQLYKYIFIILMWF